MRLKVFKYKVEFEPKKFEIKPDIQGIFDAVKSVKESKKLKRILEVILHLGNFLNAGTSRGKAWGFKLNTLSKLSGLKTTDNQTSLMQFLVKTFQQKSPELLELGKELKLEAGVRVNLNQLQGDLGKLTKDFEFVKKSVETVTKLDGDKFHEKISAFITLAEADLQKMNADFEEANKEFQELVKYYSEDPKQMGPDEFFKNFKGLVDDLEGSLKALEEARVKAEKAAKRDAAMKNRVAVAPKKGGVPPANAKKQGIAVADELFGRIKAGNVFRQRREDADQQVDPAAQPAAQPAQPALSASKDDPPPPPPE